MTDNLIYEMYSISQKQFTFLKPRKTVDIEAN